MQTHLFSSEETLGDAVATKIIDRIQVATSEGRPFVLGCPGGRSPKPVYAALARLAAVHNTDLSHTIIVMMDDYLQGTTPPFTYVDSAAHYSCRRFATQDIARLINRTRPSERQIRAENIWFPDPKDSSAYDDRIAVIGGIDLFLLASGASDGHIAFNPPGSARDSMSRIVRLAEATRRDNLKTFPDFDTLADVPKFGVTIGVGTIAKHSKSVAMILLGHGKRLAFDRVTSAKRYEQDWPATIVAECARAEVFADMHAAGRAAR